jgi:hypothetical protein
MNTLHKIAVVQAYINHIKGVTVNINPPQTLRQHQLLDIAYNKAQQHLDSIILLR